MCFICSGCFQARTDLTISEDGSVKNNIAFVGVDFLKEQIEDLKNSLVQSTPSANVTSIALENMSGYNIEALILIPQTIGSLMSLPENITTV